MVGISKCCNRPVWYRLFTRNDRREYAVCSGCFNQVPDSDVIVFHSLPGSPGGISLIPTFGHIVEDINGQIQIHPVDGQGRCGKASVGSREGKIEKIVQREVGRTEADSERHPSEGRPDGGLRGRSRI